MNTYNRYNWNQVLWGGAVALISLAAVVWMICEGFQ